MKVKHSLNNAARYSLMALMVLFIAGYGSGCRKADGRRTQNFTGVFTLTIGENGHHTMEGQLTHLGKFTAVSNDNEDNFPDITGSLVMTTEQGDQIFVTHTGHATERSDGTIQADFDNTITGGTGRFKNASGHFDTRAIVDDSKPTAEGTVTGVIVY